MRREKFIRDRFKPSTTIRYAKEREKERGEMHSIRRDSFQTSLFMRAIIDNAIARIPRKIKQDIN